MNDDIQYLVARREIDEKDKFGQTALKHFQSVLTRKSAARRFRFRVGTVRTPPSCFSSWAATPLKNRA